MPNSWDNYYNHYSDWDEAHCFNVRIDLKFEENLKALGYIEYLELDDIFYSGNNSSNTSFPQSKTYIKKNNNEIIISFEVPYDWSIDTDWEDKALSLLGLSEEWVIDSSVEDN
tara:strand:+ start:9118 stop:9456 length:339 start_codon:yes stop_codon:yes gene_type:complete